MVFVKISYFKLFNVWRRKMLLIYNFFNIKADTELNLEKGRFEEMFGKKIKKNNKELSINQRYPTERKEELKRDLKAK